MKNVLIFGDSYSTFAGYIPEGYAVYYAKGIRPQTGVDDVSDTWWHKLITRVGANLVHNNSWSGSTICHTGYGGSDCSKTSSFICRLRKLRDSGFFEKNDIDTVFVFGGTNDSWSNAPLGEPLLSGQEENDLYSVLPAIPYFLSSVKEAVPNADIICIINTGLKDEITEAFIAACEKLDIKQIRLKNIDKVDGHPTSLGMTQIAEQILNKINR